MSSSQKTMVIVAFLLTLFALLGVGYLARTKVEPGIRANVAVQEKYLKNYLDDLDHIRSEPALFPPTPNPTTADASEYLNRKLVWEHLVWAQAGKPLVPLETKETLMRLRGEWLQHRGQFRRVSLDFSILAGALAYNYWDIEKNSPIVPLIENKLYLSVSDLPIPDSLDMAALIKLRLIRALEDENSEEDRLQALKEVRHMALLFLSTENFSLSLAGISYLDLERRAAQRYLELGLIHEGAWVALEKSQIRRADRVLWAARGYLRLMTPWHLLEKALLDPSRQTFSLCAVVNESLPAEWSMKPLLAGNWPGEDNFNSHFQALDQVFALAKKTCRLRYLTALHDANHFDHNLPVPKLFAYTPYLRQVFGLKLASLNFVGFEGYLNPKRK